MGDDAFALAHAGRARVLQLRGRMTEARTEATRARQLAASATERERSHVDLLATMIEGNGAEALALIRAHVGRYPRDAFALQPATAVFGLIGFSGRVGREQEVLDLLRIDEARALAERIPWRADLAGHRLIDRWRDTAASDA